jgi:hypothetical protein
MSNPRPLKIGFMMDQIAGHVTNYRNLRKVLDDDPTVAPTWWEIDFYKEDGLIERASQALRVVPTYPTGVLRGAVELRRGMTASRFDAIYCNSSVAGFFSRRFADTPTMFDSDSTPLQIDHMPTYESPDDARPVAWAKHRMSKRLFHKVARVQAWSSWARGSFIADYDVPADRVVVNPPGVDLELWRPPAQRRTASGAVRVLFVGADFDRKGGRLLLDWFHRQPAGLVDLHLVTRAELPPEAGLTVHNDLHPNSPELMALYRAAELFVLPSLGECFGIATVEAMAAGLPVITSDAGGTADIIDHGRNGFIVDTGEQQSLDAALDRLVANAELRGRMGDVSRSLACERFDLRTNARRVVEHLRAISDAR